MIQSKIFKPLLIGNIKPQSIVYYAIYNACTTVFLQLGTNTSGYSVLLHSV